MGVYVRALAALVVAVIIAVVAFDAARHQTLQGSELGFTVYSGRVALINESGEPVAARLTSSRAFRIVSADGEVTLDSTREGTGRDLTYVFEGDLPAGNLELQLARGSDVAFQLSAPADITAGVAPRSDSETTTITVLAALAILGALFYASRATGHGWFHAVRRRLSRSTASQEGTAS